MSDLNSPPSAWRRSSYCESGNCVEVVIDGDHVAIRNSAKPAQPPVVVTQAVWTEFLSGIKQAGAERLHLS